MTEREALYAAICADPEDTTLRLAYADWLDERAGTVECSRCKGRGAVGWDYVNGVGQPPKVYECPECAAPGYTPKPDADADLAEFIRVQCELGVWAGRGHPREAELLAAHPEWRRAECPECGREGKRHVTCAVCGGTGDLFLCGYERIDLPNGVARQRDTPTPRTVTFRNGFIDSVTCELRELGKEKAVPCPDCGAIGNHYCVYLPGPADHFRRQLTHKFVPSAWAAAVVRAFPVTRFVVTDWGPTQIGTAEYGIATDNLRGRQLPKEIVDEVYSVRGPIIHPTSETTTDVLALAAGRVVRRAVCGESLSPKRSRV